ncbi:MAG: alkaline phosphatase family protein [Alistipes sp.]|jgi:arylsulfatase A-like enzyme|nr:alkaline phosphatase family protein [Alistipes sp.]
MQKIITTLALSVLAFTARAQTPATAVDSLPARPRLIVNMIVSGLPYNLLEKFRGSLSDEGFVRFAAAGTSFSSAHFGYMQTLSPTGIATITTGVNPSMHGIVAGAWMDYVTGRRVELAADDSVQGIGSDAGTERYSPRHVVMPTLGDKLLAESPTSKVISIASDPVSAIVAGGQSGTAYWMDGARAAWISSTAYMTGLPDWVVACNVERPANRYIETGWTPARPARQYRNRTNTIFGGEGGGARITSFRGGGAVDYGAMMRSPLGNTLVADFARLAVTGEGLGTDDATDILNICFDASRTVGERFGSGSMEVEDMIYRLDMDLGGLVRTITAQIGAGNVLFVVTSDHGMSDGWESRAEGAAPSKVVEIDRFNVAQFKTILNSFLGVQFGVGDWVMDYIDRQVYLNRNLVYQQGLNLEDVQNRAAAFVLQFRGLSHVLTSTALSGGYFGSGYGHRMQTSFYPRRGGDLMINLMPGWIEERPGVKSLSGSMYDYDTHVPLILFGWRIPAAEAIDTGVDITSLAPTLARIAGIGRLTAAEGAMLPGVDKVFETNE